MRVITPEEFEAIPLTNGIRECPGDTDYSLIKDFGKSCSFGEDCRFGESCSFGELCSFGERCSFRGLCRFGERCNFGKDCGFGRLCRFGERCSFGKDCGFGALCSFGERCNFGEGCKIAGLTLLSRRLLRIAGISKSELHELYCWPCESGFYAQVGCYFGDEDSFSKEVEKKYGENSLYEEGWEFLKKLAINHGYIPQVDQRS